MYGVSIMMECDLRKNLFTYATTELSQDAFLCWLFANYDSENESVSDISVNLLSAFSFELQKEKIKDLEVFKQWKYIDVLIQFKYENTVQIIAIEDKTLSQEHYNQLDKYNHELEEYIKSLKYKVECHKIFYKTSRLDYTEKHRIDNLAGWTVFDIKRIYEFFSNYSKTGNDILDDYIDHIDNLYNLFYNYKSIDFFEWLGNNLIFKQYCDIDISKKAYGFNLRSEIYHGKYVATYLQKDVADKVTVELAIFFRDFQFYAWFKSWEKGKSHSDVNPNLRNKIICAIKNCLISKKWQNEVYRNRILRQIVLPKEEFNTFVLFDKWIDDCINDFRTIVNYLQSIDLTV